MTQLQCNQVTLCYDKKTVIDGLSFSVTQGEIIGIVGENGSGKSTLLKAILGLKKPTKGTICYTGNGMGYLPQGHDREAGFPATVKEVIASGLTGKGMGWGFATKSGKTIINQTAQNLQLTHLLKEPFESLSGGQQQRVLLARALLAGKEFLILDEPVTGLDPHATHLLYDCIKQQNKQQKTTVLMVSHHIDGVFSLCDKILHLGHEGHFFGTTEQYLLSPYGKQFLKGESICG